MIKSNVLPLVSVSVMRIVLAFVPFTEIWSAASPDGVPVSTIRTVPATSSFCVGELVPIPRLPEESIRIASAPPSEKAMVSAAGKKMPVLVSPVLVIAGSSAVPAAKDATPEAETVVKAPVLAVVAPIDILLIVPTPVEVSASVGVLLAVRVTRFVYAAPSTS